jgi:hypothetical protein
LPHLLNAFVAHFFSRTSEGDSDPKSRLLEANGLVKQMFFTVERLQAIVHNNNMSIESRAAASFFLLFHPGYNQELSIGIASLLELYHTSISSWYLKALVFSTVTFCTENDLATQKVLGRFLENTRSDFEAQRSLQPLFRLWRETSSAPVQSAGVMDKWLVNEAKSHVSIDGTSW